MVGRNIAEGRWSFQLVEEFDDGYWSELRAWMRTCAASSSTVAGTCSRPR